MFAYELCQDVNQGKFCRLQIMEKLIRKLSCTGILKEILHIVKWKHLENSGQFVANFMNILKEFRKYTNRNEVTWVYMRSQSRFFSSCGQ